VLAICPDFNEIGGLWNVLYFKSAAMVVVNNKETSNNFIIEDLKKKN